MRNAALMICSCLISIACQQKVKSTPVEKNIPPAPVANSDEILLEIESIDNLHGMLILNVRNDLKQYPDNEITALACIGRITSPRLCLVDHRAEILKDSDSYQLLVFAPTLLDQYANKIPSAQLTLPYGPGDVKMLIKQVTQWKIKK